MCELPRGALTRGKLGAGQGLEASQLGTSVPIFIASPCFRDSLRLLGSLQVLRLAAAKWCDTPLQARRERCRMWKSAIQATFPTLEQEISLYQGRPKLKL
jgi:hypothetical protein